VQGSQSLDQRRAGAGEVLAKLASGRFCFRGSDLLGAFNPLDLVTQALSDAFDARGKDQVGDEPKDNWGFRGMVHRMNYTNRSSKETTGQMIEILM
jgi:hypothetical protein